MHIFAVGYNSLFLAPLCIHKLASLKLMKGLSKGSRRKGQRTALNLCYTFLLSCYSQGTRSKVSKKKRLKKQSSAVLLLFRIKVHEICVSFLFYISALFCFCTINQYEIKLQHCIFSWRHFAHNLDISVTKLSFITAAEYNTSLASTIPVTFCKLGSDR